MTSNKKDNGGDKSIIGLTGGIGTGKSTAARYLVSKGFIHVDADAISRQITEKKTGERNPLLEEIGRTFSPDSVLLPDGSLDRGAMADLVFSDSEKKKLLEDIMFREIIAEIHRQIDAAAKGSRILLDVPLLFESGLDSLCDKTMVLTAKPEVRIARVVERDGCTPDEVQARIRNQMPDEEKIRRADYVIDNSGTHQELTEQLDHFLCSKL